MKLYTIEGLKISDSDILQKIEELLQHQVINVEPEKYYRLKIIYRDRDIATNIDLKQKENDIKDQIYKITSENLTSIEQLIERYNAKICASEIIGRKLDESKIIVELIEEEPVLDRKKVIKVRSIMLDETYSINALTQIMSRNLSEIYCSTVDAFGTNLLCEALNIPITDKHQEIFSAFVNQHKQLGFMPSEEDKNKFKDKILEVIERRQNKE